jgi:molybdenum cofactor synthesis domain-containing protein
MKRSAQGLKVFLLTVGREILMGRTLDTNAHWLAAQITRLGGRVCQIACVDDRVEAIAAEIRAARRLGAHALVTTGGLGPTHDDLTLPGVAAAVGTRLRLQPAARKMLGERYRALHTEGKLADRELTPARLKMGRLPVGAEPLHNYVGTAPGMLYIWRRLHIFSLPGVPAEMRAMFAEEVAPRMARLATAAGGGGWAEIECRTGFSDESMLAPALDQTRRAFPGVHVKSHASGFGAGVDIRVTLSVAAPSKASARERARAARHYLLGRLQGGSPRSG